MLKYIDLNECLKKMQNINKIKEYRENYLSLEFNVIENIYLRLVKNCCTLTNKEIN